ncbi:MAG: hypothetical protein KBD83_03735 [Gammaproteobacteria bacterium]|nr:hypothetical protein [Gammaproteobacteria bacterium]
MSTYQEYNQQLTTIVEKAGRAGYTFLKDKYEAEIPEKSRSWEYRWNRIDGGRTERVVVHYPKVLPPRDLAKYWNYSFEKTREFLAGAALYKVIKEILTSEFLLPTEKLQLLNQTNTFKGRGINFLTFFDSTEIFDMALEVLKKLPGTQAEARNCLLLENFNRPLYHEDDRQIERIVQYIKYLETTHEDLIYSMLMRKKTKSSNHFISYIYNKSETINDALNVLLEDLWLRNGSVRHITNLYRTCFGETIACEKIIEKICSNSLDWEKSRDLLEIYPELVAYLINKNDDAQKITYIDNILFACLYLPSAPSLQTTTDAMERLIEEKNRLMHHSAFPSAPAFPQNSRIPPELHKRITDAIKHYRSPAFFLQRPYRNISLETKKADYLECIIALADTYPGLPITCCIIIAGTLLESPAEVPSDQKKGGLTYGLLLKLEALDTQEPNTALPIATPVMK